MDALRRAVVSTDGMQRLIELLASEGYRVVGPTLRDQAIVYDDIASFADLPRGWIDRQEPGRYRLERRADQAFFGFAVGPHSWKRFLHPPVETLWTARRGEEGVTIDSSGERPPRYAFIGVRACELHAIAIQDKVFLGGPWQDAGYGERRRDALIIAVNCAEAGGTCFCVSMDTGPRARTGFDLGVTELLDDDRHEFFIEAGSDEGVALLTQLPHRDVSDADIQAVETVATRTANSMGRHLETDGLKELLQGNPNHPRWDQVAERCLTCGNCTMVCPTCFCTTVEDQTDVALSSATRVRKWDSCFTMDFSFIHGGSVRSTASSRYRQWMTHKLAHWIDQFGTSGCVGCGRCITWCPVGIDITEEAAAIRTAQQPAPAKAS